MFPLFFPTRYNVERFTANDMNIIPCLPVKIQYN